MTASTRLEEAQERIAEAYLTFGDRIRAICEGYTNDELHTLADEYDRAAADGDIMAEEFRSWAGRIRAEVGVRVTFERAELILSAGGAYCVAHDCDTRECHGKGLHE